MTSLTITTTGITALTMRDKAVALARRGLWVFRLQPNSKLPHPGSRHHSGKPGDFCFPSCDPLEIFEEWTDPDTGQSRDCNIGVDTTRNLVVFDIDCKAGKAGREDWDRLKAELGAIPDGYRVDTPSKGFHVYTRNRTGKRFSNQKVFGPNIDIKAHHGYVLGEGSIINGVEYTSLVWGEETPDLPQEWEAYLAEAGERAESQTPLGEWDVPANIDAAVARILEKLPEPSQGDRNNSVFKAAGILKDFQVSEGLAFELIEEHYPTGLSEREIKKTIRSCYAGNSQNQPGVATPEADFGDLVGEFDEVLALPALVPAGEPPAALKGKSYWFDEQPLIINIPWLVDDAIPEQSVGFLAAKPGMGKTFVVIDLAMCTAFGLPFFGRKIEKRGGVHIIAAEGGYSIQARISAALNGKFRQLVSSAGYDPSRIPISYDKQAPNLLTNDGLVAFIEQLREDDRKMREHYGVPLSLVIIDTFGQTFTLKDENAAADVSRATRAMRLIASALRVTVISTHHYGKDERADMRGSSALRANADFVLAVKTDGQLRLDKCRDAAEGILGHFDMPIVEVGTKPNGDAITSRYISTRDMSEWPEELLTVEPNRSEVVFEQSVAAMLDAKGVVQAPNGEGAPCRMVRLEDVRLEFYRLWGQTPAVNRQAFHRVVKDNLPTGYQRDKWAGCDWLWKSPTAEG